MIKPKIRNKERVRRHKSIRKKVFGTSERPRLCVFRSLNHIYVQVVDDSKGTTLVSASSLEKKVGEECKEIKGKKEVAKIVGSTIARRALEKDITKVVFDRAGYKYHGRVKTLADSAREAGLVF